jgi:hypothetical protein
MASDSKGPKGGFALLIGKAKKDKPSTPEESHAEDLGMSEGDDESSDDMDSEGAEDSAAKDMMTAIHSQDVEGFKSALHDFLQICYPLLSKDEETLPKEESKEEPGDSEDSY